MRRIALIACLLWGALAPAQAQRPAPESDFAPGEVLVQFRPGFAGAARGGLLAAVAAQEIDALPALNMARLRVPPGQEAAVAARLNADSRVRAAGLNYIVHAALTPNDPYYAPYQWDQARINLPAAWNITTGSADVVIAVVDTGLDYTHPEFAGKIAPGINYINLASPPHDDNGHGTHVAGVALATGNNGMGIAGVSWGARVMPIKTLGASGAGSLWDSLYGIYWAADHGARIINLSWTVELSPGNPMIEITQWYVDYAYSRGCLLVAAAGNKYLEGNPVLYPAACNHVLAVAATGVADERAPYSEVQSYVDVAAPGGIATGGGEPLNHYVYSAIPTSTYGFKSGTSQAAPHVAGLAALVWSMNPTLSVTDVVAYIQAGAVYVGPPDQFGAGRIDAWATLQSTPHYLQLSPTQITFLADSLAPGPFEQQVVNPASSSNSWSAAGGASWLTVSGPTGQTPSAITVTADASGLPGYGVYPAAILASSTMPYKVNSPVVINVTLIYTAYLYRVYLPAIQNQYQ